MNTKIYRILWLLLGLAVGGLELSALINIEPGDTLSEQFWWLFGLHPALWWLGLTVAAWGVVHIFGKRK